MMWRSKINTAEPGIRSPENNTHTHDEEIRCVWGGGSVVWVCVCLTCPILSIGEVWRNDDVSLLSHTHFLQGFIHSSDHMTQTHKGIVCTFALVAECVWEGWCRGGFRQQEVQLYSYSSFDGVMHSQLKGSLQNLICTILFLQIICRSPLHKKNL